MPNIFKYKLKNIDVQMVSLPRGAEILSVQSQDNNPVMWAIIDQEEKVTEQRVIRTFGTGNFIDNSNLRYISTTQFAGGSLVFHYFEDLRSIKKK